MGNNKIFLKASFEDEPVWDVSDSRIVEPGGKKIACRLSQIFDNNDLNLLLGPDPYEDDVWRLEVTRQKLRYEVLVRLWLEDDQWTHTIDLSLIGIALFKSKEYKEGIKQVSDYIRTQLASCDDIEELV